MGRFALLLLLTILMVAPAGMAADPLPAGGPRTVRVMSFNIRYGTANDGEDHWDKRKGFLIDTIRAYNPDLLGTH